MSRLRYLALLVPLLAAAPAVAAPPPAPAAAQADPFKAAYEALPPADRRAVQAALGWTGDFNGAVAGTYGPRTREALAAYAGRTGLSAPALLAPAGRAKLLAAADAARRGVGFATLPDARAGFALGVPAKLLPVRSPLPNGTRYAAPDGGATLDVVGRAAGPDALADVFARLTRDAPGRTVTYKLARPDFVVVTGEAADHKFYDRYAVGAGPSGGQVLRGFAFTYPAASAEMDRVALAVAATFDPFAAATPDATGPPRCRGRWRPPAAAPSAPPLPGQASAPSTALLSGQALLVAPDLALTRMTRERCPEPLLGGAPATWSRQDAASGLALLTVPGHRDVPLVALSSDAASGARYALFQPGDGPVLAMAGGTTDGPERVRLPLQGADAGVLVLDAAGRLAGLTEARRGRRVAVGGVLAATAYDVAGPATVAGFLAAAAVPVARDPGPALAPAAAASRWRPLVLALRCRATTAAAP